MFTWCAAVLTCASWLWRAGSLSAGSADTSTERERVTLRASFANFDRPATGRALQLPLVSTISEASECIEQEQLASLGVVGVDGLLERGDVAEGEQEEHDQLALVADRRHVHQQPQRRACSASRLSRRSRGDFRRTFTLFYNGQLQFTRQRRSVTVVVSPVILRLYTSIK